jgi:simple sugar transport system permease protein
MEVTLPLQTRARRVFADSPIAGSLLTLLVTFTLFVIFVPNFATWRTISGIISAVSISGFVTIGITLLMIGGEFDLSVSPMVAMSGYLFGAISVGADSVITERLASLGLPVVEGNIVIAVLLALAAPALMGLVNGLILVSTGVPSFIVTLGTRQIYRGLVWIVAGGALLQTLARPAIYQVLNGRFDLINNLSFFEGANFRTTTLWLLVVTIIVQLILVRTRFGNQVFAVGGQPDAARSQGVRTKRVRVMMYVIVGVTAGMAGIISFSQFHSVRVAEQAGIELTAIAAAVVGGTLLKGGWGSIWGALIGIVMINMLRSGVILLDLPFIGADNFPAVVGVTIIGAAILNDYLRNRSTS